MKTQIEFSKPNERLIRVMLTQNLIFEGGYDSVIATCKEKDEKIVLTFTNKNCSRIIALDNCEFNLLMTLISGDNNIIERDIMCNNFNNIIAIIFENEHVG